jgi:hypothetical protein
MLSLISSKTSYSAARITASQHRNHIYSTQCTHLPLLNPHRPHLHNRSGVQGTRCQAPTHSAITFRSVSSTAKPRNSPRGSQLRPLPRRERWLLPTLDCSTETLDASPNRLKRDETSPCRLEGDKTLLVVLRTSNLEDALSKSRSMVDLTWCCLQANALGVVAFTV